MTNNCWNEIGVWGDRACGELKKFTHCRNCPVYGAAGRNLLEREAPADYLSEWTNLLAEEIGGTRAIAPKGMISVVIFRLVGEWVALPAQLFKEVTPVAPVHTLPHRSNDILMGLVNIRGEIQMCVSLSNLLGLESAIANPSQNMSPVVYKRMVVVERDGNRWVFPVDEIYNVHRFHPDELRNVPATVSKVTNTYTKGMLNWRDKSVSYLDDELLFYTLNKRVL